MQISYSNVSEWMHSSYGAFEESIYIYSEALNRAHELKFPLKILSVGLGLGYNEIISTGFALKNQTALHLEFFESEAFLIESFQRWIESDLSPMASLYSTYELILDLTAIHFDLPSSQLRQHLTDLSREEHIKNLGTLSVDTSFPENFSIVYFDPFSSKASPEFWSTEFIHQFLDKSSAANCVVSTYAATGHLKRSLKELGFEVDIRPGFAAKRNSTLAIRHKSKN
jgi:hypothetical protein